MVTIDPTSINRNLTINTNGGDDAIVLDEVTVERNTTINTGTGMDGLTILSSMLSRFEADLGDGNDVLTMTSTTVTARSTVSTAGGDDQVLLNNNTFQWRLVIDMGVGDLAMDRFEAFNNSFTGGSVTGYTENLVAMGGNTGTLELTQMLRRGRGSAPRRRAR
jgi:hypothetical protein